MFIFSVTRFGAIKMGCAGIVFVVVTTGISGPRRTEFPESTPRAVSGASTAVPLPASQNLARANLVHENDVRQMQQSLRDQGHYSGVVDGVIGLRTRASIRAYQKAANLPVTGELDIQTAGKLGVEPESAGNTLKNAALQVKDPADQAGSASGQGKPSAGIQWASGERRSNRRPGKPVAAVTPTQNVR